MENAINQSHAKSLQQVMPDRYIICTSRVAQELTRLPVDGKTVKLEVAKDTSIQVSLATRNPDIHRLTSYDMAVLSAIISLYVCGKHFFTPATIYRVMCGLSDSQNPGKTAVEQVRTAIERLQSITVEIDAWDQGSLYGIEDQEARIFCEPLLQVATEKVVAGNSVVTGYALTEAPVLYRYSLVYKQLATFLTSVLSSFSGNNNRMIIGLRYELLRLVCAMSRNKKMSRTINYDSLMACMGITASSNEQARIFRKNLTAILDSFIIAGLIDGYSEIRKNRAYAQVCLTFPAAKGAKNEPTTHK